MIVRRVLNYNTNLGEIMKYFDYNTLYDGVYIYGNERIFEDHWFYDEDLNEDILFCWLY